MLASELGAKPYLLLEIDAATADAGVQTRLEAFLDIISTYRPAGADCADKFVSARLGGNGCVIRANGEVVALTDPRVKIYLPNFSDYHAQTLALALKWLGLHPGKVAPLTCVQLDRGLLHTSGRECLPLPLCIGQILQIHEQRAPGEIAGFYSVRGGAPCVSDAYLGYFERFIRENRLPDLFIINAAAENNYLGCDEFTLARHVSSAITIGDLLVEMDHVLRVAGSPGSLELFEETWASFSPGISSLDAFNAALPAFVEKIALLPLCREPGNCPRVLVTGDFFTRFNPFFIQGVRELYAAKGIIMKPVDLSDLVLYGAYDGIADVADCWGMKPGTLALAKACTRIFHPDGKQYLQNWLAYKMERRMEQSYRRIFRASGLLVAGDNSFDEVFEHASEHVSPKIFGETIPAVGKGLDAALEGYDGTLLIGPFNCLPYRISEAILGPISLQRDIPLLAYESDGYAVAPSFLRQVDVHIQQILGRVKK
jgi:predicted nucleotide-binding protein (sugar kinase/HSP70/actin superfamily)